VLGVGAFGALTACIIAAIALALPTWAAALIVAVVYAIVAAIVAQSGRSKLAHAAPMVPQQTTQTVKEDVEWVKTRAQSGRR
jgi:tetrahydromethanopterin S-methyltransferase subunit C